MIINSFSTAGVSASVWSNAARTLTADPATDAGAAALVWARAVRSLTVDPATDAGAAALVWARAARTLTADPATDAGAGTIVWTTHASRKLSGAAGLFSRTTVAQTSLANGASVDLRPGANVTRCGTISCTAITNFTIQYWDGTNVLTLNANGGGFTFEGANSSVGIRIINSTGVAQNYMYTFMDYPD